MANLFISSADQVSMGDTFNDLHATFARPISIFRDAKQVVINTSSTNNVLFPGAPVNTYVANTQVSGVFLARIRYPDKQARDFFYTSRGSSEDQINIRKSDGLVRIKLDPTGASYLNGAQRVQLDGDYFTMETDKQPHGLVSNIQFYTFYLKRDN